MDGTEAKWSHFRRVLKWKWNGRSWEQYTPPGTQKTVTELVISSPSNWGGTHSGPVEKCRPPVPSSQELAGIGSVKSGSL